MAVAGELWTSAYGIPTAGLQLIAATVGFRMGSKDGSKLASVAIVVAGVSFLPWLPNLLGLATGSGRFWTPRPDLGAPFSTFARWITDGYGQAAVVGEIGLAAAIVGLALSIVRPGWLARSATAAPEIFG